MNKNYSNSKLTIAIRKSLFHPFVLGGVLCSSVLSMNAFAQEANEATQADENVEVIQIQGIRRTIQDAISIKKESMSIVDGLSASDIGELPAISIAEAIETLTGASGHREQGGATEISIRGLGSFLGSTVMNGREAANGSGDRSVNFSQFPSELFNKIAIYKTQEASLIEGGVSGQIHLDTLKPLDFGKQRFQIDVKGNYNPDNSNLEDPANDIGSRLTASFVDQYNSESLGEIGISLGIQKRTSNNPEQEARTTSGWRDCANDPSIAGGVYSTSNCDSGAGNLDLQVDPNTGVAPSADTPYVFVPSQRSFRQNVTDDERDSFFAAVQWRPTNRLEINVDGQVSDRTFTELRHDLVFAENRRIFSPNVNPDVPFPTNLTVLDSGAITSYANDQRIETNSQYIERIEEYEGGGISFAYDVNEVLRITADYSTSKTFRQENIYQTRLQSDTRDIYGNLVPGAENSGRVNTRVEVMQNGSEVPTFMLQNFDVTHHELFSNNARTRMDLNQYRNHKISAFRSDVEFLPDSESFSMLKAGIRSSTLEFDSVPRVREEYTVGKSDLVDINNACANDVFPESGFLSGYTGGQALITNVDDSGNVIPQGTGNTWATFDPICLATAVSGISPTAPAPRETVAAVDVEEKTFAAYFQANYDIMLGDYPARGNFGVRYVKTEVNSRSLRGKLEAQFDADFNLTGITEVGELQDVYGGGEYSEILPSFNLVVEVDEDVLLRGGIFRALSRPDPSDLGYGRSFSGLSDSSVSETVEDAIGLAVANGNPFMEPFTSWNYDLAVEWYPNNDTLLALGVYYKDFTGGFENASQIETFVVDEVPIDTVVTTQNVVDDTSTITGFELTATHSFSYTDIPVLQNMGFKVSYNFADSDFEFEDAQFGASQVFDGEQLVDRVGIVPPANITGLSEHVLSSQLYYQNEGFNVSFNYKYRSEYFQQFISTPGNLRFVGDTGVYEFKSSYRYNRNWKFSVSAINIFDEPKRQYNPTVDNFAEINVYGPRIFAGVTYRL